MQLPTLKYRIIFLAFFACYVVTIILGVLIYEDEKKQNSALRSEAFIKSVELDLAKRNLEDAHELNGLLFYEGMRDREIFKTLKKLKCK